jgi:hypothetical protein
MTTEKTFWERVADDRARRERGVQLCSDAADRVEAVFLPGDPVGSALVAVLRKTAWMGGLSTDFLARVPCGELLDLAEAVLATYAEPPVETCPYTFSHTRHWCGRATCRES